MNTRLKLSLSLLTLALTFVGCSTVPFFQPAAEKTPPVKKAPVTDRSARRPQTAQPPTARQLEVRPLPPEDPLLPREYAPGYPSTADPYAAPTQPYRSGPNNAARQPDYPPAANTTLPPASNTTLPPTSGDSYRQPAYPPGAATSYPSANQPYYPTPRDQSGRTALPPTDPAYPQDDPGYAAAPTADVLPEPQPAPTRTPPASLPASASTAVAIAPPPTPVEPVAPPPQPSAPPADLPPAEITREGNQAVAALLESADKHVKNNQLDKAGAALERALRIEPRNAGIWHDLAQIRLHQGQYAQAESLASKSANLAGSNRALQARNWKVIASARKAAGNRSGAEEAEARAVQLSR